MGKKKKKSSGSSRGYQKKRTGTSIEVVRARIPSKADGEVLAIVTQILGNDRMRLRCADGKERLGRIRGKIKKRMWVRLGDLVLISPWEFQDDRCDIIWRYRQTESAWLERKGYFTEYLDF
ncbi:MAG: translation initiation factor eIF-1A [Candidatus Hodarchaeota archaeon]